MKLTYNCYSEYVKCIHKLVWKYVKKSRFSFDELLSEAHVAFLHTVDTYNSTKASFHTHLYITISGRLRNFISKETETSLPLDREYKSKIPNPEQECTFKNLIENLSKEAKEIVDVVLNTPTEMIELIREMSSNRQGHMHLYRKNVTYFFKNQGWSNKQIFKSYSEIKSIL